jgi:hypothetical protein
MKAHIQNVTWITTFSCWDILSQLFGLLTKQLTFLMHPNTYGPPVFYAAYFHSHLTLNKCKE